jgi:hypothetical protein
MLDRVTTTIDSLAKIIQTLSSGGLSGRLLARREYDIGLEEGEIFFNKGKIVDAKATYLVGAEALDWMKTWQDCTFSFHPSKESQHIPILPPAVLSDAAKARNTTGLNQDPPVKKPLGVRRQKSDTSKLVVVLQETLSPEAVPYRRQANDKALQLLKEAACSRIHRHIFLLVDGHRSVSDLMRLIGRDKDEVVKLLRDLEKLDVIHIPN